MDMTAFAQFAENSSASGRVSVVCKPGSSRRAPGWGDPRRTPAQHPIARKAARPGMAARLTPVINMGLEEIQKQAKAS